MNKLLTTLENWNCDIAGAMRRFLNDESLYTMCLSQMMSDENFETLGAALAAGQSDTAFESAHALKGAIANMGVTPLYDQVVLIVEPLRGKTVAPENLLPQYRELMRLHSELAGLIKDC